MGREEYRATLERLFRRRRFGMRPGLEVIRALLEALGHPERSLPAVHITGSKGKGSVAAMVHGILTAHGIRVGLFTSPHLASYRERIRVDGHLISPAAIVRGVERIDALSDGLERTGAIERAPTFFEVTTALALDWFRREKVEALVVEVGIGGRVDATNVLDARVGVLTTIELEHTDVLGPTIAAISYEKSGILHPGMTGVVGELVPEASSVVEGEAARRGVPLWHLGREVEFFDRELFDGGQSFGLRGPSRSVGAIRLPLAGRFQPGNAALAFGASFRFAAALGRELDDDKVRAGFAGLRWPGRLERVSRHPQVYYDIAHTPDSARAVAQSLVELVPLADPEESTLVFGSLRGKDVPRILDAFAPLVRTVVLVPVRSERGLPTSELRSVAVGRFPRVVVASSAREGARLARLATGPDGYCLVAGSDYLVGELLKGGRASDEPDLSDPGLGTLLPSEARRAPSETERVGAGSVR